MLQQHSNISETSQWYKVGDDFDDNIVKYYSYKCHCRIQRQFKHKQLSLVSYLEYISSCKSLIKYYAKIAATLTLACSAPCSNWHTSMS